MITKTPWIERKFAFDTPAGLFPCILERLRGTPARISALVSDIPAELYTRKPDKGWTIQQHIGHLASVEELFDNRLTQFIDGAEELIAADMTNQKTEAMNYNQMSMDEVLTLFRTVRGTFVKRLEEVEATIVERSAFHPRLKKPMRLIDLVFFTAEHDDNHLADIVELWNGWK